MNVLIQVHDGVIMFAPMKNGKMQGLYPLTTFEARMIANELLDKADEIDETEPN